ncbi:WD40 repeat domain-containing protein [Anatilimnocola aggregata]|uniref:WD40 repeat domain-containing protein n=1 Tax=Anatilimnocola aggregata TaxID=2528021 RepID=UPI0011A6541B|nr:hypothetical protein [Anatilimnocola aggregata]
MAETLELWRIQKNGLELLKHLSLAAKPTDSKLTKVRLAGAIAVAAASGRMTFWNMNTSQLIASLDVASYSAAWAISPGGKYVSLAVDKSIFVLNPATGDILTTISIPAADPSYPHFSGLCFSEDGARLALTGSRDLWIFTLTDGKCAKHIGGMDFPGAEQGLQFGSRNTVVFQNRLVFDYDREFMLCRLTHPNSFASSRGRQYAMNRKSTEIIASAVPDEKMFEFAKSAERDMFLRVRPGSFVGFSVEGAVSETETRAIKQNLKKLCEKKGWIPVLEGNQTHYTLAVNISPGNPVEVAYELDRGRIFPSIERVTVTPLNAEITLCLTGTTDPLWKSSKYFSAPSNIQIGLVDNVLDKATPKVTPA